MTVDSRGRRSPMRGRYFIQSRIGVAYLASLDSLLAFGARRNGSPHPVPRRILVGVGGHLGDAVIATGVLPALAAAYPDARIGVAAPSWTMPVFVNHPLISWIHVVDHWRHNRVDQGMRRRIWRSLTTSRRATQEIAATNYDVAVDLYPFYPNMALIFRRSGIPRRIGYESGGGGPALTESLPWKYDCEHIATSHSRILSVLTGKSEHLTGYRLAPLSDDSIASADALLSAVGIDGPFMVLHPGSGDARKEWPAERWGSLASRLVARGRKVVITGMGARDIATARIIRGAAPGAVDCCGKTDFSVFRALLRRSDAVVAADSVAGHLAAAEGRPTVTVMASMSDPAMWRPLSQRARVVSAAVPCAPCFRPRGCDEMNCVRDVSVESVLAAIESFAAAEP